MSHKSRRRVSRGDRISASEQNEFIEAIRSQRLIPVSPIHGGGGKPLTLNRYQPFWAKLLSGTNPYAWQEVYWNGSAWTVPAGARSGTLINQPAYEVTNINNLAASTIVLLLEGFQGKDYRFAHLRYGTSGDNPCPSNEATLCVIAWDIKGYCDFVSGSGHKYDPATDGYPGFLYSGATVTIKDVDFTVLPNVITTYDTGTTDSHGSYCKTIPPKIGNPSVTPTIDPVGGGTSGGAIAQAQYTAAYTFTNQYGETKVSPSSASFQIGVPAPTQSPTTATPTINVTGGGATGGSLQADTYYLRHTFTDGTGETTGSLVSLSFTVAAGNIPRVTLPGLGSRTYATGMSIYLAADDGFGNAGPYHRYATGVTGTTFDLTAAWVNTNPAPPGTNTTAKNIPRMSVSGSTGSIKGNIYLSGGYYHAFTALPVDFTFALSGTPHVPPSRNATAPTRFKVEVSGVGDCPALTYPPFWVSTPCSTVTVGVGFCCFKNCFNVGDFDLGGTLNPTSTCGGRGIQSLTPGSGGCTNISDIAGGLAKPTDNTFYGAFNCLNCVDNNSGAADDPNSAGGTPCIWTHCRLVEADYWDRCVRVPSPCDVPSITTTKSFNMKSKLKYVRNLCCGECSETPPGVDLTPETVKRQLFVTFNGPGEIFGAYNGVSIPLNWLGTSDDGDTTANYNNCTSGAALGDLCYVIWDSGCLSQSIAQWFWAGLGFCFQGADEIYVMETHEFASCRARVVQAYHWSSGSGSPHCYAFVSFQNFINDDCTDTPLPTGPPNNFGIVRGAPYCDRPCATGGFPPGARFVVGSYQNGVLEQTGIIGSGGAYPFPSYLCSPVNYSGGNNRTVTVECSGYSKPSWTYDLTE